MKQVILLNVIFFSVLLLTGCSVRYDIGIVNKSSESLKINIVYENTLDEDTLPFYMSLEDWENNQKIFAIVFKGRKEWKEMPTENYETNVENSERKIRLAPNEVVRIEKIRSSPKYDSYDGVTTVKSIHIQGKNGELILKGKYIYKQFEEFQGGFFISYK